MLQKQVIPMPVTKGIDKYTPDLLRDPDSLSEGVNTAMIQTGEIVKRDGFAAHAELNEPNPLAMLPANGTVGIASKNGVIEAGYFGAGSSVPTDYENVSGGIVKPVLGDLSAKLFDLVGFSQTVPFFDIYSDESATGNITFAFVSSNTTARVYKFDKKLNIIPFTTSTYAEFSGFNVSLNGIVALKCLADKVVFWSTTTGQINLVTLNTSGVSSNVAIQAANSSNWDVCRGNVNEFVLAYTSGANITISRRSLSTGASIGSVTTSATNVTRLTLFSKIQVSTSNREIYLGLLRAAGNKIEVQEYSSTLTLLNTATQGGGSSTYYTIAGCATEDPDIYYVAVESGDATVGNTFARKTEFYYPASASTLQRIGDIMYRAGVYSKGHQVAAGQKPVFILQFRSEDTYNLQNSYFLMQPGRSADIDKNPGLQGMLEYGRAFGYQSFTISSFTLGAPIPSICALSTTEAIAGLQLRSKSSQTLNDDDSVYNVGGIRIREELSYHGSKPIKVGSKVYLACGNIYSYSGTGLKAINFLNYPDQPISFTDLGAGSVAAGTYQYCLVYEYRDDSGELIQSAPSQVTSVTHAGTRQYDIVHRVPGWIAGMATWSVVAYRTTASGIIFYRCAEVQYTKGENSPLSLVDNVSDATLATRQILYTTGGIAENIAPPYTNWISQIKNRLWTFKHGSSSEVWFSKTIREGFIPEFSDLLTLPIDIEYGEIKGVAGVDDKIIILKENALYAIVGEGPTDNLVGSFSQPSLIAQGVGCINSRSILETPSGVFYESKEGIYLITKGLENVFIGQPVFRNAENILASVYESRDNKAMFLTGTSVWVFYMTTRSWHQWTVPASVDLQIVDGDVFLLTTADVLKQTAGTYQDDGANFEQRIKFGQYQFAGIQGYQRVYRMLLTGAQTSSTTALTVKTFFDGNTTATDTLSITAANSKSGNRMAFEVRPSIQKCETMKLEVTHEGNDEGIKISAVTAEIGALPGAGRRAATGRAV